jgi:hypothetical protein
MSGGNILFITLHNIDKVVYIYISRSNTLLISLHCTDKIVYALKEVVKALLPDLYMQPCQCSAL